MDIHTLGPKSRLRSFRYAFQGVRALFHSEPNAWIHCAASATVIFGACFFDFSAIEWALIIVAIGIVFSAEALNTSIETLCDYSCGERNEMIGRSKDLAAAGVLIASTSAAAIGFILFIPKIILFIESL
ncbi:MAG: diacylglycerol kinase family protein [Mucinivorans sp.]